MVGLISEKYQVRPSQLLREIEQSGMYDVLTDLAVLSAVSDLREEEDTLGGEIQREYRRLARLGS